MFRALCTYVLKLCTRISPQNQSKDLFIWEAGRDVKWDLVMHVSLIFTTFRLYEKNIYWDVFRPVPAKRDSGSLNPDLGKIGTMLSPTHFAVTILC